MQFITELLVAALVAYMAFTNSLADHILAMLTTEPYASTINKGEEEIAVLPTLPSLFGSQVIPDILLRSTKYQQAALAESGLTSTYVTDPLEAIVNIYCTFATDTTIRTTTGTGFFVHSNGVIMTNAHVAQYLLLETSDLLGDADCFIRQGNPAVAKYRAELLYIPPAWVERNAAIIDAALPTGTGERDYALLYVAESLSDEPLPAHFPALALDTELLPHSIKDAPVQVAGYPATDLLENGASSPLLPQSALTTISDLYTFGSNYADVFSIRGTSVGAAGSSGGPIVNAEGKAIGMIVTRGDDAEDGAGSLRAITVSHIHRTILEETGFALERNVVGNLPYRSQVFRETLAPFLLSLLATELAN